MRSIGRVGGGFRSGVTLMEVLIAVSIVAILASFAIPQYRKTFERNYRQQAQDLLTTIYYGERAYRLANGQYLKVPPGLWTDIFMDDPQVGAPPPITFAVPAAAANTFTATATRPAGTGVCASKTLSIDEKRTMTGTWLTCP